MAQKPADPDHYDAIRRSLKAYEKPSKAKPQVGRPNAVSDFVTHPGGILKELVDQFEESDQVKSQILQCIPEQFQQNITGYRILKNQLSLLTNNASSATQLRFVKTEILSQLRQSGLWNLSNITIKVDPNS